MGRITEVEADMICKETVKNDCLLNDADKVKRPKKKRKKYVNIFISSRNCIRYMGNADACGLCKA